jgi:hypothetical protein
MTRSTTTSLRLRKKRLAVVSSVTRQSNTFHASRK